MSTYAVSYTFVVEADDKDSSVDAVEEYIHSTKGALDNPTKIEELEA